MKVKTFISSGRNLEKTDEIISKFLENKEFNSISVTTVDADGGILIYVVSYEDYKTL